MMSPAHRPPRSRKILLAALLVSTWPASLPAEQVREGLASRFPLDQGLAAQEDVLLFSDFEDEDWKGRAWKGGDRDTVTIVRQDPERRFEPLRGGALRIAVKEGGHYGASIEHEFRRNGGTEPEEIFFRYYLRLADDWDPPRGGKLPGIGGTYGRAGWGGRPSDGRNGWSARGLFEGQVDGRTPVGFYCYHADMKGKYGAHWRWERENLGLLENNRWYCLEQQARMNTPGKNDGILRAWIDGQLAFEKTDLRMRDIPELRIEAIWINLYHGGSWPAASDDHLYLDHVVVARRYIGPIKPIPPRQRDD